MALKIIACDILRNDMESNMIISLSCCIKVSQFLNVVFQRKSISTLTFENSVWCKTFTI